MTAGEPYRYTDRDLLQNPESYEYTEFQGEPLLRSYLQGRRSVVEKLGVNAEPHPDEIDRSRAIHRWNQAFACLPGSDDPPPETPVDAVSNASGTTPIPKPPESGQEINTAATIGSLTEQLVEDAGAENGVLKAWLDLFIQRFEVQKRLYASYTVEGSQLRAATDEQTDLRSYPLLGVACILYHHRHRRSLKAVNTALKIGDTLVSISERLDSPEVQGLTEAFIGAELHVVHQLSEEQGVKILEAT